MTSIINVTTTTASEPGLNASGERTRRWTFTPVPPPSLPTDTADHIQKWGLGKSIRMSRFAFDKKFQAYDSDEFLQCLFADPNVQRQVEVCSRVGAWVPLHALGANAKIEHEIVDTTWVNLEPLMRFRGGAVRNNDMIVKCFDETYDGIVVSDELRKVFLGGEDSDFCEEFSEVEKGELLFRLLGHIVVGGPLCQYEDSFKSYIDAVRDIYKSLVKVVRNDEKQLSIVSQSFKVRVTGTGNDCPRFFPNPSEHPQDFCYVCVDPISRYATVLYGAWET